MQGFLKGRHPVPIGPDVTMVAWDDTANARRLHDRVARVEGWVLLALALFGATVSHARTDGWGLAAMFVATGVVGAMVVARPRRSERAALLRGVLATVLGLVAVGAAGADAVSYELWFVALGFTYSLAVGGWGGLLVAVLAATSSPWLAITSGADTDVHLVLARSGAIVVMGLVGRRLRQLYLDDLRRLQLAVSEAIDRSHYAAAVLESQPSPTAVLGADGIIHATNAAWTALAESRGVGTTARTPFTWFCDHALLDDPAAAAHVAEAGLAVAASGSGVFEIELRFGVRDRSWYRLTVSPLPRRVGGALVSLVDITVELEHQKLRHRVDHDDLTGLPNRSRFTAVLDAEIRRAAPGRHVGVLFIDLDRFKQVNDTYGHAVGDGLLQAVGARMRAALRPGDTLARLSGDEFAAICPDLPDAGAANHLARRLLHGLDQPFEVDGRRLRASASVGAAIAHRDESAAELLARADQAMYQVKRTGRRGVGVAGPIDLRSPSPVGGRALGRAALRADRD